MGNQIDLVLIAAANVRTHANTIDLLLTRAKKYYEQFYTLEDILDTAEQGKIQVWIATCHEGGPFACILTEIKRAPDGPVLHILQFGGLPHKVMKHKQHFDGVEQWALGLGITRIEAEVIDPLLPTMFELGFVERATVVTKQLGVNGKKKVN